jgi:hypothetical protein
MLIHLKRAAGSPKDLEAIAEIEALREERGYTQSPPWLSSDIGPLLMKRRHRDDLAVQCQAPRIAPKAT